MKNTSKIWRIYQKDIDHEFILYYKTPTTVIIYLPKLIAINVCGKISLRNNIDKHFR